MSNIKQPPEYGVPSGLKEQFQILSAEESCIKDRFREQWKLQTENLFHMYRLTYPVIKAFIRVILSSS